MFQITTEILAKNGFSANFKNRFWKKVIKKATGCWIWTGATDDEGYGRISKGSITPRRAGRKIGVRRKRLKIQRERAHRVSWFLHHGPIPKGKDVLHKCDNPPCPNPKHLFLGTQSDNAKDMIKKGRQFPYAGALGGELGTSHKLSLKQVTQIREMLFKKIKQRIIAKKFRVKQCTISDIKTGRRWWRW